MKKEKRFDTARIGSGVPPSGSRATGVPSAKTRTAARPSARSRANAHAMPKGLKKKLDAYMDIGWAQFAIGEMANNLKRPGAYVDGITKALKYQFRSIIRNKKILGEDTAGEERRLAELNALAGGVKPKAVPAQRDRSEAKSRNTRPSKKATPKNKG